MSLQAKGVIFPQQKVTSNIDFTDLCKDLSDIDLAVFYMLADATCSTQPKVDIEKIHIDVFKHKKISKPRVDEGDLETLEILNDSELMKEIKISQQEAKKGNLERWAKVKVPT